MTKVSRKVEVDMINGPLFKKVLVFAVPIMLSNMLQLLFNAADVAVVGQFCGTTSVAAVSSNGPVISLVISLAVGMGTAINVVMARFWGAGDYENAHKTVQTSLTFSIVMGLVVGALGFFLTPEILKYMSVPEDVMPLAVLYLRVYFAGIPSTIMFNYLASVLRAVGDTQHPFYYLTAAGIFNVVFNLIFVIVFNMDVAGVALASALSQVLSSFLTIRCLMKKDNACKLYLSDLKMDKKILNNIITIGVPSAIQGCAFSISNITIQAAVNSLGKTVMAGVGAACNVDNIVYFMGASYMQTSSSFMSQNYGAGKKDRLWKVVGVCVLQTFLCGLIAGNLAYALRYKLLRLFIKDAEAIEIGSTYMLLICAPICIDNVMDTGGALQRGLGSSWTPMIVTLIGVCVFRVAWVATVFKYYGTLESLLYSYIISWILTGSVHYFNLYRLIRKETKAIG